MTIQEVPTTEPVRRRPGRQPKATTTDTAPKRRGRPKKAETAVPVNTPVSVASKALNQVPEQRVFALPNLEEGDFVIHSFRAMGEQEFTNDRQTGGPIRQERWVVKAENLSEHPDAATDPDARKATEFRTYSRYLIEQLVTLKKMDALPTMAHIIRRELQGNRRDQFGKPVAALVIDLNGG